MPIVGVGASAGGIEAIQQLLEGIPADTDMAFVVILHLAPDRASNLSEVLQQSTDLPVERVDEGTKVLGGHVYVIPPGQRLEIEDGHLRLDEVTEAHDISTVDRFFRSLAADQGANAVGIVLSGSGADGALGLRAIKEESGVTFVQSPEEAQYDHMPESAIATGLVDLVLPAMKLAEKLLEYRNNAGVVELPDREEGLNRDEQDLLQKIFTRLYTEVGLDFSGYKRSTVLRRLERRLQVRSINTLEEYLHLLREDPKEVEALKRDFLISVTSFFRDRDAYRALQELALPRLFENKGPADQIRVWVPGCATGEEAYSLAILLLEQADTVDSPPSIQVFATDVDEEALEYGREGLYPETIRTDVPNEWIDRYFRPEGDYYQVAPRLRETILFAGHDLLTDPPFSNLDLVSCRNLLIYLKRELQDYIFRITHYGLKDSGYLFLGRSEALGPATDLFSAVDQVNNILRARVLPDGQEPNIPVTFSKNSDDVEGLFSVESEPSSERPTSTSDLPSAEELHNQALMQEIASILVDENHQIVHLSDAASQYLNLGGGTPSLEVLPCVPEDIRPVLQTALFHAFRKDETTEHTRIEVTLDGQTRFLDLSVHPIKDLGPQTYASVRLEESDASPPAVSDETSSNKTKLETELERTREQLQSTSEEYEAATEEMEAANEELLSMNEELQSKNEELKTSKEELQSVNEELATTNQELKAKIKELREANSDLENLMAATDIATLFLDRDLKIQRFTPKITELFNIRPPDVGRPLSDFTQQFEYDQLFEDARMVLRDVETVEHEIRLDEDKWLIMRLRPYRTVEGAVEGVVLTFVDISNHRQLERRLINATEEVRQQIGWDLHDVLSSDLAALNLVAGNLQNRLAEEGLKEVAEMEQIADLAENSIEKARTLADELVPVTVQGEPLALALQQLCRKQDDLSDLRCTFDGDLDEVLPASDETTIHLYRIAQEAITNARRHAEADEVRVSFRHEDNTLRLRIQDDGVGLPDEDDEDEKGFGLQTMKHRANLIGGSFRATSREDGGTLVQCDLPC